MPKIGPRETTSIGDMNGWTPVMMRLFLISWPVFLTAFIGVVAWGVTWGSWVTSEIKAHASDLSPAAAATMRDDMREERSIAIQAAISNHNHSRKAHE